MSFRKLPLLFETMSIHSKCMYPKLSNFLRVTSKNVMQVQPARAQLFTTSTRSGSSRDPNTRDIFRDIIKSGKGSSRKAFEHMRITRSQRGARRVYYMLGLMIALTGGLYLIERSTADCKSAAAKELAEVDMDDESEKSSEKSKDKKKSKSKEKHKDKDEKKKKEKKKKKKDKTKKHKSDEFTSAIEESRDLVQRIKDETGTPGLVVAVSVDGEIVWDEGFGYSDLENRVPCTSKSVMRIASISKPVTVAILARLLEEGKLDLDRPVEQYVSSWPQKSFKGEKVSITTRQLLSHQSGVRHYDKDCGKKKKQEASSKSSSDQQGKAGVQTSAEFKQNEYHLKKNFPDTSSALALFKDDELCFKPGSDYMYTTHGYTLISAVIEGASGKKFTDLFKALVSDIGMEDTYLDENSPIIYNRARPYQRNKRGRIVNAPYVNNSYKWAGGGFLSTVCDLLKFGNAMLYSYQSTDGATKPGYLKPETIRQVWQPVSGTKMDWDSANGKYAMGWGVVPTGQKYGSCHENKFYISHTGGAIGASSVLLVMPTGDGQSTISAEDSTKRTQPPKGIIVAIVVNMEAVGLNKTAKAIAHAFSKVAHVKS